MRTESHFRTSALSRASAVGLMQLIVPTAKSLARQEGVAGTVDRTRLQDPDLNIRLGTRFLGKLSRRFDGHAALIAAGYNAGPGGPSAPNDARCRSRISGIGSCRRAVASSSVTISLLHPNGPGAGVRKHVLDTVYRSNQRLPYE